MTPPLRAPQPTSTPTPVFATHEPYRRALGGVTSSTARAADARGAVVGVPGVTDWPSLVAGAIRQGAVAVVVDDPAELSPAAIAGLPLLMPHLRTLPVLLERPRLRADLCRASVEGRAGLPARAVVVECAGASAEESGLLRDAVGWGRVLSGGELALCATSRSAGGLVSLLEGPPQVPVTIVFTTLGSAGGGGLLRVSALGETRTEVTIDLVAGVVDLDTVTAAGTFRAAPLHESSHRLALRRGVVAAASGKHEPDVADFAHDCALTAAMLAAEYQSG